MPPRLPHDVDALLFDLGGVLIEIDWQRAFDCWAADSGVPAQRIAARFSFDDSYAAHERGEIGAGTFFASLRNTLGVELSDAQWLAGWNAIFVQQVAGVRELLAAAANRCPLFLFSNTCEAHRKHWARCFAELLQPFSGIYLSCEIGLRKPDPDAFQLVARRMGVEPGRILFFDDSEENVTGARNAGIHAVHIISPQDLATALAFCC